MPGIIEGPFRYIVAIPDQDPWKFFNQAHGYPCFADIDWFQYSAFTSYDGATYGEVAPGYPLVDPSERVAFGPGTLNYQVGSTYYRSNFNTEIKMAPSEPNYLGQLNQVRTSMAGRPAVGTYGPQAPRVPTISQGYLYELMTIAGATNLPSSAVKLAKLTWPKSAGQGCSSVFCDGVDVSDRIVAILVGATNVSAYLSPSVGLPSTASVVPYLLPESTGNVVTPFAAANLPDARASMAAERIKNTLVESAPGYGGPWSQVSSESVDNQASMDATMAGFISSASATIGSALTAAEVPGFSAPSPAGIAGYQTMGDVFSVDGTFSGRNNSGVRLYEVQVNIHYTAGAPNMKKVISQLSASNAALFACRIYSDAGTKVAIGASIIGNAFAPLAGPTFHSGFRTFNRLGQTQAMSAQLAASGQPELGVLGSTVGRADVQRVATYSYPNPGKVAVSKPGSGNIWALAPVPGVYVATPTYSVFRQGAELVVSATGVLVSTGAESTVEVLRFTLDEVLQGIEHASQPLRFEVSFTGNKAVPRFEGSDNFLFFLPLAKV